LEKEEKTNDFSTGGSDILNKIVLFILLLLNVLPLRYLNAGSINGDRTIQHAMTVHMYIAREAYDYYVSQFPDSTELDTYIEPTGVSNNSIIEGARDADIASETPWGDTVWYNIPGPYMNHLCAGADGSEFYDGFGEVVNYYSAYEFVLKYWDAYVIGNYNNKKGKAYYYLGHVAHILMDMCVPAHTHNDFHSEITSDIDSYESSMESMYTSWGYGNGSQGGPTGTIEDFNSLYELFQQTADYTEEYDSNEEEGNDEPDYPNTGNHRPDLVDRSDGISSNEVLIIGDDLMPFAMKRVAALYKYFYTRAGNTYSLRAVSGYPNPCYFKQHGYVTISNIPVDANNVNIYIYNLAGELVYRLTEGEEIEVQSDSKVGRWDGRNENNEMVASGIYIYLVKTENGKKSEKIAVYW
jgi:hypothetical protein